MRIVVMGTSEFAVPTMLEIVKDGHTLVAAYTRSPAAGGRRGLELKKTPVHVPADGIGVPVFTPTTLRSAEAEDAFNGHAADVVVVTAYGLLLPITILKTRAGLRKPPRFVAAALAGRGPYPARNHGRRRAEISPFCKARKSMASAEPSRQSSHQSCLS